MSRLLAALAVLLFLAAPAAAAPSTDPAKMPAGTWQLDKTHGSLIARVQHMGLTAYTMRFNSFDASYDFNPDAPDATKVTATIDLNSLDVGDPKISAKFAREFLDADDHPTATFVSTGLTRDGDRGTLTGDLTFRGQTHPVTLQVVYRGYATSVLGSRTGFSATGQFRRSNFGSSNLSSFVADDIELVIEVEFTRK
ncbi:MAG: polyisoprenoid-binding protein [Caulobacter sp.]|nr:polyisoprenoid-binding protein [Caulobacter sp.]